MLPAILVFLSYSKSLLSYFKVVFIKCSFQPTFWANYKEKNTVYFRLDIVSGLSHIWTTISNRKNNLSLSDYWLILKLLSINHLISRRRPRMDQYQMVLQHFCCGAIKNYILLIESLSTDVFEARTPTGSRLFFSFECVIDFLSLTSTYKRKNEGFPTHLSSWECVKNNNGCLPDVVRGAKTSVLKPPII